ncbi:MAG: enoyl-CoA hydratase/isomerase family protein [Gammaproteobacteria bacterium]|nr:enoyl-CoA hydratase/isomerase family protein [Gammaproteobacteria bacterium]
MTYDYVSVQRQGRVAIVTFDRGNPLNALSLQAIEELADVAGNLERDLEVSAIVLTTPAGTGFSAGRDLTDPAADRRREMPMLERRHAAGAGKRLCAAWESIEAITIAAIERFAIGGGLALALAFDLRVMGQGAHVRAPEVSLGLSMSWGSIPRLINLVGPARTKQILCLANDRITADDALAWGLVQAVVPDGKAAAHARTLANRAATMPPVPLRMTKTTVNAVAAASAATAVHMDTEEVMLTELTEDFAEAMAAFREQRTPGFRGA